MAVPGLLQRSPCQKTHKHEIGLIKTVHSHQVRLSVYTFGPFYGSVCYRRVTKIKRTGTLLATMWQGLMETPPGDVTFWTSRTMILLIDNKTVRWFSSFVSVMISAREQAIKNWNIFCFSAFPRCGCLECCVLFISFLYISSLSKVKWK